MLAGTCSRWVGRGCVSVQTHAGVSDVKERNSLKKITRLAFSPPWYRCETPTHQCAHRVYTAHDSALGHLCQRTKHLSKHPYSKLENVCTVDFEDFLIPRLFLYNFKLITDITSTYFSPRIPDGIQEAWMQNEKEVSSDKIRIWCRSRAAII